MIYTLMQKNEPVMKLDINEKYGRVRRVIQIENPERLPLSVRYKDENELLEESVEHWMRYRNVPKTREGLGAFLKGFQGDPIQELSLKSLGLNLSDQYWFEPEGRQLNWKNINFFQNDFTGKPLEMTFESEERRPDYSSNGDLSKYWTIKNIDRVLLKAGKGPLYQEPINEVIASKLLTKAEIPHVEYSMEMIDNTPWSECPTFVNTSTEYIPAYEVLNVVKAQENEGPYNHFLRCIKTLGIPVTKKEIDTMLQFDYLINNRDRHFGNFGFIRNVDTLEFKGFAPLFDNGNSLWFDKHITQINQYKQPALPFAQKQEKQLKKTSHQIDWLKKLDDDFIKKTIITEMGESPYLSEARALKITETVLALKKNLEEYMTHSRGIHRKVSNHEYTR